MGLCYVIEAGFLLLLFTYLVSFFTLICMKLIGTGIEGQIIKSTHCLPLNKQQKMNPCHRCLEGRWNQVGREAHVLSVCDEPRIKGKGLDSVLIT